MAFRASRKTFTTGGTTSIPLPFTPNGVMIFVAPKGSSDTVQHFSHGAAGDGLQNCIFVGPDGSKGYGDRVISMWESGVEVLRVDFVSFDTNGITFDAVTPNSNYQAYMRYLG
jgi:hypothetical protein